MRLELKDYNIFFEQDFKSFNDAISPLSLNKTKVMIVFDSNTARFYKESFMSLIKGFCAKPFSFLFEAGENSKNLDTVQQLYEELIKYHFERKDVLIAFGGGVVGDLTGFVAATYLRGIRFIQIPTSLLAMADSGIGGKTGVDFLSYKNMIGAFHQPSLVYINLSLLETLPDREYLSGMAEIIKAAYIKDKSLLENIKRESSSILNRDYKSLAPILFSACDIKKKVVEADFKEKGERALLNFGHTLGHAVEKLMDFKWLHGECVSIGMVYAANLSVIKGFLSNKELEDMKEVLKSYKLPVNLPDSGAPSIEKILKASKLDKKMEEGMIKFILLDKVGEAFIDKTVSDEELLECMKV